MMRLSRLNTEHRFVDKMKMTAMRVLGGRDVPDVVKLHYYRPDYLGKHMGAMFQEAMRGPSAWDIFEREVMASFVSNLNQCVF